ncbi:hypothetical protein D3C73_1601460 [compost metagenome]
MSEGDGDGIDLLPCPRLGWRRHTGHFGLHARQQSEFRQELLVAFDTDHVGDGRRADVGGILKHFRD